MMGKIELTDSPEINKLLADIAKFQEKLILPRKKISLTAKYVGGGPWNKPKPSPIFDVSMKNLVECMIFQILENNLDLYNLRKRKSFPSTIIKAANVALIPYCDGTDDYKRIVRSFISDLNKMDKYGYLVRIEEEYDVFFAINKNILKYRLEN